MLIVFEFINRR